tara:strand:+ start:18 stop:536 length:519 start_codon:yes stop_codon:yes gene_type:complete
MKIPSINLPNLPNTNYTLNPPKTTFYLPKGEIPYLDPGLIPSLDQVTSTQEETLEKETSEKKEKSEEVGAVGAAKPQGLNNLPQVPNTESSIEVIATFSLPFLGEMPVPAPEVIASSVIAAGTASVVSVAGGIAGQAAVTQIKKIFKKIFTKILKKEVKEFQTKKDSSSQKT